MRGASVRNVRLHFSTVTRLPARKDQVQERHQEAKENWAKAQHIEKRRHVFEFKNALKTIRTGYREIGMGKTVGIAPNTAFISNHYKVTSCS